MSNELTTLVNTLDAHASADIEDDIDTGAVELAMDSLISDIVELINELLATAGLSRRSITADQVVAVLATHGASIFTLEQWASDIADRVRSNYRAGSWSDTSIADVVATSDERNAARYDA